jgi:hypothetical protein
MPARLENFDVADYFDDLLEAVEGARGAIESDYDMRGHLINLTKLVTLVLQDAGIDVPGATEPSDSCEDSV